MNTSLGALGLIFNTTGYAISGTGTLTLGSSGIDASALSSGTTTIGNAVTLAADQSEYRQWRVSHGLRRCLGAYESAEEAEQKIPELLPDVVLMDINLPGQNGISCVAKLKRLYPQIEFLMLITYDSSDLIFDALRVGASGYLLKRAAPEELLTAIKEVREGGSPMSSQIARKVVSHFHRIEEPASEVDQLTKREREILGLLAKGFAYKEIAAQLFISRP